MKSNMTQNSRIKLVIGIIVPVLVMVITGMMLGMSFAWFGDEKEVYIESISLSTKDAYSVVFDTLEGDNLNYKGQTAIAPDGRLVTTFWASANGKSKEDKPFCFVKSIRLDTLSRSIDINVTLDSADIYSVVRDADGNPILDADGNEQRTIKNSYDSQKDNLPFAFTWFFKAHEGDESVFAKNYIENGENNYEMIDFSPADGEIWFTPYGQLTFGENSKVKSVNGEDIGVLQDIEKRDIVDFSTGDTQIVYDFYIVFAPEELFYKQFFAGLEEQTVQTVYADYEEENGDNPVLKHIFGTRYNQMYYSGYDYLGSRFAFSALINVTKLNENGQTN